jgi:Fe-S-cluster containining protein
MSGPSGARPLESWDEVVRRGPWGPPPAYRPPAEGAVQALRAVYARADEALAGVAACRACGRCCRFERLRPVLFASALELAHLVSSAGRPPPDRAVPPGQPDAPWRCPYQEGDVCGARDARPLGCRTYFCDDEARRLGERTYAALFPEVRRIHDGRGGPWWYGPARAYLADLSADGA